MLNARWMFLSNAFTMFCARRGFANTVACVSGFLATITVVFLWPPAVGVKFRQIYPQRHQVEVLFVGSSVVYHGVDPVQFDREVAAGGGPRVHSFNLADSGAFPPETYYSLRRFLDLKPERLRWVVLELRQLDPGILSDLRGTERFVSWHDFEHTQLVLDELRSRPEKPDCRQLELEHLSACGVRSTSAAPGLQSALFKKMRYRIGASLPADPRNGFLPQGSEKSISADEAARFTSGVQRLRDRRQRQSLSAVHYKALERLVADVHRAGAELIFLEPPCPDLDLYGFGDVPGKSPVLRFQDPVGYPELFLSADRYDALHFRPAGAARFTSALAAVTQRVPPAVELTGFKMYHL